MLNVLVGLYHGEFNVIHVDFGAGVVESNYGWQSLAQGATSNASRAFLSWSG